MTRLHLSWLLVLAFAFPVSAQQWQRYVPPNRRGDLLKKNIRTSGMGAVISGKASLVIWITEPVACALVSNIVDHERLTADEAEAKYRTLYNPDAYTLFIGSLGIVGTPFGAYTKREDVHLPESFLQRADDKSAFAKGEAKPFEGSFYIRGMNAYNQIILEFPKVTRSGQPYIKDLADKIEIQFVLSEKKIVLQYKVKDIAASLNEL
jgi:hypothetical protein